MFKNHWQLSCTVGLVALLSAGAASAQTAGQVDQLQAQINELQKQIAALKGRVKHTEDKVVVVAAPAAGYVKGPVPAPTAIVLMSPNNRPSICTPDQANCIALTSRLHLDVGGYNYSPHSAGTAVQGLDSGINARRARIGILGTFQRDWNYGLVYDFGGSSDGFPATSGAPTSGIENAYLSYTGFKPVVIEGGYMDTPYTLDEATSSNDIMFMERSSSQVIATSIAAGDSRSVGGIRGNTDRLWGGFYVTGPTSGANHAFSTGSEQTGAVGRVTYQLLQDQNYSLHIGGDAEWLIRPSNATGAIPTLTLSDRPELRIDPTSVLTTGAIANVSGAQVYSAEVAGGIGSFYVQGEYFNYNIDRVAGLPSRNFDGGYVEASYTLTGESRKYLPGTGAYSGITPNNPFSREGGGWGAWEIAGRYSVVNLNDAFTPGIPVATTNGIAGGTQTVWTAGLNWYVNRNVRLMFNYLHGDIDKQSGVAPLGNDIGASFDAFAMRTQVAF